MSLFTSVKVRKPKRNRFNLSHNYKMTGNMGLLYPILCEPVVPGDTFKIDSSIFLRTAPMIAPMMSKVTVYTHYFFVPNRLIWSEWKDFITGGEDGTADPATPKFQFQGGQAFNNTPEVKELFSNGSLADYLGFPVFPKIYTSEVSDKRTPATPFKIDQLPFRAYGLIWNEYYRDENLQDEIDIHKDESGTIDISSQNIDALLSLQRRAWKKDYFTSALPWPQRGDDVELPLSGEADVLGKTWNDKPILIGVRDNFTGVPNYQQNILTKSGEQLSPANRALYQHGVQMSASPSDPAATVGWDDVVLSVPKNSTGSPGYGVRSTDIAEQLKVDLSGASSATINELRRAIKAQEFLELNARGGSRYIEQILSHFGVRSSDARLQRPEFLGGGKQYVVVSDVLQTSSSDATSPQANQAGIGASLGSTHGFKRFFEEHGFVIGIMSIVPDASYMQGMPRKYLKEDRYDYYWPTFAHLGEQEIQNQEIYFAPGNDNTYQMDGTFGYTPRYSEYKHINDSVHGDFRTSLAFWHLGRIFDNGPRLNGSFIESKPSERVFATDATESTDHHFWINIQHNIKALRPMPKYGTPMF